MKNLLMNLDHYLFLIDLTSHLVNHVDRTSLLSCHTANKGQLQNYDSGYQVWIPNSHIRTLIFT